MGFQLCDVLEKAKLWKLKKDQWLPGPEGMRDDSAMHRGCLGQAILCDTTMGICVTVHLSKPTEYTSPRVDSDVIYGLW